MGKKIFVWTIVAIFMVAVGYFVFSPKPTRPALVSATTERFPVISIEGLIFWNYKDEKVAWKLTAQNAIFVSPDQLELHGRIRYERPSETNFQAISCENALFNFETQGVLGIHSESQLKEILVEDDVRMQDGEYTISTRSAKYSLVDGKVTSSDPVNVDSTFQKFSGDNGFVYDVRKGNLQMGGGINGEIVR